MESYRKKVFIFFNPYLAAVCQNVLYFIIYSYSNVVVQIVDARNPLLFRCEDLESYVAEVNNHKVNVLLINKADFLTQKQRYAIC